MVRTLEQFIDPHFLTMLFAAIAAVATVLTLGMPLLARDTLSARMKAVAFGFGGRTAVRRELAREDLFDGVFRLEVNEWNGITEPRLNLVHLQPCAAGEQSIGFAEGVPYPVRDARRQRTLAG